MGFPSGPRGFPSMLPPLSTVLKGVSKYTVSSRERQEAVLHMHRKRAGVTERLRMW